MRRGLLSSDEASSDEASNEHCYPLPSGRPSRRARGTAPVAAASAASSSSAFAVAAQAAAARSGCPPPPNRASVGAAASAPESPIVSILETGVRGGHLVKQESGNKVKYVGFTEWKHMAAAVQGRTAGFESMASNRLVNQNVVNERIAINEDLLKRFGAYADFGTVILIVVRSDLRAIYRIMDGQHRVRAMQELYQRHPATSLPFCLQVTVVSDEAAAHAELMHFQVHHPADPRAFFGSQRQRDTADQVLARARSHFTNEALWKQHTSGRYVGRVDPVRPYLSDYVLLGLLQEAALLDMCPDAAWQILLAADALLKTSPLVRGKNTTEAMAEKAEKYGCYLGFLREGTWWEVRAKLPAALFSESDTATSRHGKSSKKNSTECVICLEPYAPGPHAQTALVPCGHQTCRKCANVLKCCPVCRKAIDNRLSLYD
jgi:hypothetical protein